MRFVGLARPGHPDGFAGSGISVVTSLTTITRKVLRTKRLPVRIDHGTERMISGPEPSAPATVLDEVINAVTSNEASDAVTEPGSTEGLGWWVWARPPKRPPELGCS